MNSENYTNPFDSDVHQFLVLKNAVEEYSLWPAPMVVPAGWEVVHGPDTRETCSNYVDAHWHSINPFAVTQEAKPGAKLDAKKESAKKEEQKNGAERIVPEVVL